ncbi:MAG: SGNH/GDSL hydrolase family protein [Nostoc sp.]
MIKKHKISAKDVDTRILAIYALDQFIDYIRTVDPDLKPDEATLLAAIALHSLPELFQENPLRVNRFKEAAAEIKRKKRNPQSPTLN